MRKYLFITALTAGLLMLLPQSHAQSASAVAIADDLVRVTINGAIADQACPDTQVDVEKLNPLTNMFELVSSQDEPAGTSSVDIPLTIPGTYRFGATFCVNIVFGEAFVAFELTNTVNVVGSQITPSPVDSITVDQEGDSGNYVVSWPASAQATSYQIRERSQPLDDWSLGDNDNWSNWSTYSNLGNTLSRTYANKPPAAYQYQVIACVTPNCSTAVQSVAVVVALPQEDAGGEYLLADAKIRAIWTSPEGCYVLFEDLPAACDGQFNNSHALIPLTDPNHEKMYSQAFVARAMGQSVDVWFNDNGDCSSLNALMSVTKIRVDEESAQLRTGK